MAARAHATKTIRKRLEYRPGVSEWFTTTQALFNRVAAFYFDVIQAHPGILDLSSKNALAALERLTHGTKKNPHPVMPLRDVADNVPVVFRRAAINAALGTARSFQSNLARWRRAKEKAESKGRSFHQHPPVPPRRWNKSVTLYAGMWKQRTNGHITLKLWDGQTWRWVRFRISGREMPDGWEANSPQVVRRSQAWWLHIPVERDMPRPEKAADQLAKPDARVCAVDLNINDALAVCTVQAADGTVVASCFIRGGRELHGRRKTLLGWIARNRSKTGLIAGDEQDNADLWAKVRHLDEDTAHRVSRRIVDFAQEHGATIIVFEHLGRFLPERGKYSRLANSRRAYWLRGRIFNHTRYKAWEQGLLTCRVNPRDTSRLCAACGNEVIRYSANALREGYQPGAPLVYCPACDRRDHADRNAARNIGQRLFARHLSTHKEKPHTRPAGSGRSVKAEGVSRSQVAAGHGRRNGHGTAQVIRRTLRSQRSGGHAASTPSAAYARVAEEAAGLVPVRRAASGGR
jgi:IS605 OrfB family transposase